MPGRSVIDVRPTAPRLADIGAVEQWPSGTVLRVRLDDVALAVVNDAGRFSAVRDLCLRCSGALSTGVVSRGRLSCSGCGWQYDLALGCVAGLPALRLEAHEVQVVAGRVRVSVPITAAFTPALPDDT